MPDWVTSPPSVMDIVAGFYPETKPKGELRLRPCLVTAVYKNTESGEFACEVAYGTKTLKTWSSMGKDLVIQNTSDLDELGLPVATRFVLAIDQRATLVWGPESFGCWKNHRSPRIGTLNADYQREYAYCMLKLLSV